MKPLISVITINLNNATGLKKTIKSVIEQSEKVEFIIIDGKSTDNSLDIISSFNKKIDYFVSEKDSGIYNAMNKGVKIANGEYLYFLNSGDIFFKNDVITKLLQLIKKYNQPDFIYGDTLVSYTNEKNNYVIRKELSLSNLKRGKKIPQQAYFTKKELIEKFMFDENYSLAADFDLICKIFLNKDLLSIKINEIICNFNGEGASSNLKKSYFETYLSILKNFGRLASLKYFILFNSKLLADKLLEITNLKKYFLNYRAKIKQ
ncbi:MAG: glycosyltransferase [Candidatus Pacebacteria bacterium]|nr:glycosyltransferase [Candidatus Paceibacterota bacterium]